MSKLPVNNVDAIIKTLGYDPVKRGYVPADWSGTALDVLALDSMPITDRLHIAISDGWVTPRVHINFAIWCADQTMKTVPINERIAASLEVRKRWMIGEATTQELEEAIQIAQDETSKSLKSNDTRTIVINATVNEAIAGLARYTSDYADLASCLHAVEEAPNIKRQAAYMREVLEAYKAEQ